MSNRVSKLPSSPRTLKLLEKEQSRSSITMSHKLRVSIILNGIKGLSNYRSHRELGTTIPTVKKWRARWEACYEVLRKVENQGLNGSEQTGKDHEILKQIKTILADQPRSGTPPRITLAQKEQIVALATQKPKDHAIYMTTWTHEMLAHVAMAQGIVESISKRYIGTLLKKMN